jgi:hypothetical protein
MADRGDFGRELAYTQALAPSVILLRQLPDIVRAASWVECWHRAGARPVRPAQ